MAAKRNGKEQWQDSVHKARDHFGRGVRDLAHAARDARAEGYMNWELAQERFRGFGTKARRHAATWIRKNPLQALKISALAGLVLGGWWSHRRGH